jgi:hypothetical protein
MRTFLVAVVTIAAFGSDAWAQSTPRVQIGPVVQAEAVRFEARTRGNHGAAGVGARLRVNRWLDVETDFTAATGTVRRSLESVVVSFAPPGATQDELQRLAPVVRRDRSYAPGVGGTAGIALHTNRPARVHFVFRAGLAVRRYTDATDITVLVLPASLTLDQVERAVPDEVRTRTRTGLMLGAAWPIAVTARLRLEPHIRYVWNGPARVGRTYRVTAAGITAAWGW